jgi:hypothetical protein
MCASLFLFLAHTLPKRAWAPVEGIAKIVSIAREISRAPAYRELRALRFARGIIEPGAQGYRIVNQGAGDQPGTLRALIAVTTPVE